MECAVRPAVLGDCPAITRLNREELGYDYPQEKTFAKLQACLANPAHAVFVAERGGEVVGYLHLEEYDVLYAGHMVNVLGIAVSQMAMPVAVNGTLLSMEYGGDTECMAQITFLTTAASILTIPIVAVLLL